MIQATCIPQVKAIHFNQVLNTFYYLYTDKTSGWHNTNLHMKNFSLKTELWGQLQVICPIKIKVIKQQQLF